MQIDISGIAAVFPDFRVAVLVASDLAIREARPPELGATIAERAQACRARWAATELSEIPGIAVWRRAYRAFGIKKTSYRSSVERLVKNALAGRDLPRVNAFVDLYNAVSLTHVLPLGADDLDRIVPPLAFRYARDGDSFVDMADGAGEDEDEGGGNNGNGAAPKPGEVVYADAAKVLCRRWNWRQDARSLITPQTTRAVVTLQANGWGDLERAVHDLADLIVRYCGGDCRTAIADVARRSIVV